MSTRVCNTGTVPIAWRRTMAPAHPFFGFVVCRESGGRFEQISDRSFVKHGVSAANHQGCGTCTTSGNTQLGPSCGDTYSVNLNKNRYQLGPADEVDPWLGAWNPVGSHFDRGEPDVGPPHNMDGERSLTATQIEAMSAVLHRVEVDDRDLAMPGARYFYQAQVVVAGEDESLRTDDLSSREVVPAWSGTVWQFQDLGPLRSGTALQHWSGATVGEAANGSDDGRVYVGVVVTGPDGRGRWHYEYAVHNRDNRRGFATLRVPLCPGSRIEAAGFHDVDGDGGNDWTVSVSAGEVVFGAGAGNALGWNTVYSFWFDCDAEPSAGAVGLDQALPGPGLMRLSVASRVPAIVHSRDLGAGCGLAPRLEPGGSPAVAGIPNPGFALALVGLPPAAQAFVLLSDRSSALALGGGCTLWVTAPPPVAVGPLAANASGVVQLPLPIPGNPALQGASLFAQGVVRDPAGPALGAFSLSNGLELRVGNGLSPCR